jgi:hypothetical protein
MRLYVGLLYAIYSRSMSSDVFLLLPANNTPGLSRCSNLRELSFDMIKPRKEERSLISSITSTNFRKLILNAKYFIRGSHLDNPSWMRFDNMLCELIDQLQKSGYRHILEVEFRAECVELKEGESLENQGVLPKFREKGRVSVIDFVTGSSWE